MSSITLLKKVKRFEENLKTSFEQKEHEVNNLLTELQELQEFRGPLASEGGKRRKGHKSRKGRKSRKSRNSRTRRH